MSRTRYRQALPTQFRLTASALAVLLASGSTMTWAADAVLPTVVVSAEQETATGPVQGFVARRSSTATKTDTPLIETPSSVSVITRDRLEAMGSLTINDALQYTPGLATYGADARSDYYLTLRGLAANFYQDGLQLPITKPMASWRTDPYELERVEVMRGPASVLNGSGDAGGTINLVSKMPTKDHVNEIGVEAGNFGRYNLLTDLGGAIDKDGVWTYRLASKLGTSDVQGNPASDGRIIVAPSLKWQMNPATSLTLLAHYSKQDAASNSNFLPYQGTVVPNPGSGTISRNSFTGDQNYNTYDKEQESIGYLFEHKLNDTWTFRQNFRFNHLDMDNKTVYDYGSVNAFFPGYDPTNRNVFRVVGEQRVKLDRYSVDNQAIAKFKISDTQHTLLTGVDLQRQKTELPLQYGVDSDSAGNPLPYDIFTGGSRTVDPTASFNLGAVSGVENPKQSLRQFGTYIQDQIKIKDRWVVTLGGREDWAHSGYADPASATPNITTSDKAFSGRAGVVYLADNGLAPYISYSESFQPVTGINGANNGVGFKPTTGQQVETGIKYQPKGSRNSVTVAAFNINQQNVVTSVPGSMLSRQVGEVRSRGGEFEAVAEPILDWRLTAAYTYNDIKTTRSLDPNEIGKRPVVVPRHAASLWADHRFPADAAGGRFDLGAGVRYVGQTAANEYNTLNASAYTLVDAALTYQLSSWRLAVNAANLLDKTYVSGCGSDQACFYGMGRSVVASARYQW